ncbi:hypothetical protein [Galbitalea soli]|uniref:Uncharacterized protein n=1 Tax=Galbitalea soli TaxID=1268042 RepID=A0A7C9TRR9_9MICO|nr:hypothetical protein [Galbitalea soli]NEM91502.1 hypothetical protein [Galbitalea soli]NYJ30195.1 hypothetical protein [Galbitalea soli]
MDESKTKGYFLAATAAGQNDVARLEKHLRSLLRPGQRRIHFTSESDSSRRTLLAALAGLELHVVVYCVRGVPDKIARARCLTALLDDLVDSRAQHVILERDESVEAKDREIILAALRHRRDRSVTYGHAAAHEHPLLWVSDVVAWCCYRGGDWLRRARPMIADIQRL